MTETKDRPQAPHGSGPPGQSAVNPIGTVRRSYDAEFDADLKSKPPSRPATLGFLSFLKSAWSAPLFLLPFVLMVAAHHMLGMSDALMVAPEPGERPAQGFNLLLGINMNLCPIATVLHLFKSQRTFPWMIARLLIPMTLFLLAFLAD